MRQRAHRFSLAAVVAAVLSGCATGNVTVPPAEVVSTQTPGAPTATDDSGAPRVTVVTVADGFEQPNAVVVAPNGDLWVSEQPGRVTTIDGDVLLDISGQTAYGGERGLLDIVVHPDGDRLFVHHSGRDGQTMLAEFTIVGDGIDQSSRRDLFSTAQPASNHNGGSLLFLPDDTLLLALGDGGRSGDAFDQAQDTSAPLGGLLRFDVSTPGTATPAGAGFNEPALWATGLRNPWRITVDEGVLYVADVGQDAVEEVSIVALDRAEGANFGWPLIEGDTCFSQNPCDGDFVRSVVNLDHTPDGGPCSITGGIVYRGSAIPELVGTYLYSDVCLGNLSGFRVQNGAVVATVDLTDQVDVAQVVGFGTDTNGELLIAQLSGEILRLTPG